MAKQKWPTSKQGYRPVQASRPAQDTRVHRADYYFHGDTMSQGVEILARCGADYPDKTTLTRSAVTCSDCLKS
jgi:hypothetical protein